MARVLSAIVLLPLLLAAVWLPPPATLAVAEAAALLAFIEYAGIARALGAKVPRTVVGVAVAAACAAPFYPAVPLAVVLMSATIFVGAAAVASGAPGAGVLRDVTASIFPLLYIALPLGAIAAVRAEAGREAVLLLVVTLVISDSAQYYTGRAFGRVPLAPAISPKKTREGAIGGVLFGTAAMTAGGLYVFPGASFLLLLLTAAAVVVLGIVGDLFESLLKRSAGVKDSSALIPGHGGVLDRIDSWLFAGPVYYVFVRYLQAG
ncbi:MAG TPA: phosphatidate cytidylyltransferase [Vicinamibacterales bacterium]|jgi:phosphatidate cytidylyltransferase|nr:phosphatidate cytidylyltransferase [Vicinamibacterales bacterium]